MKRYRVHSMQVLVTPLTLTRLEQKLSKCSTYTTHNATLPPAVRLEIQACQATGPQEKTSGGLQRCKIASSSLHTASSDKTDATLKSHKAFTNFVIYFLTKLEELSLAFHSHTIAKYFHNHSHRIILTSVVSTD